MLEFRVKLSNNGRVVIPAQCRSALQLSSGDELIILVDEGEARLFSLKSAVKRAQALMKQHNKANKSLVDELITTRREESKSE